MSNKVVSIRRPIVDAIIERNQRLQRAFQDLPPTVDYRRAYIGALMALARIRCPRWLEGDYTDATLADYEEITKTAEEILGPPVNYEPIATGFWVSYVQGMFDEVFPEFPADELIVRDLVDRGEIPPQ